MLDVEDDEGSPTLYFGLRGALDGALAWRNVEDFGTFEGAPLAGRVGAESTGLRTAA